MKIGAKHLVKLLGVILSSDSRRVIRILPHGASDLAAPKGKSKRIKNSMYKGFGSHSAVWLWKEKRKIGLLFMLCIRTMEKLIELLNEYDSGWSYNDYYGPFQYGQDRDAYIYGKYYLISKQYGFIKRLVENDKIDFEGMSGHGKIISYLTDEKDYKWNDIKIGVVLMLLSISDTPIDDLISYLK